MANNIKTNHPFTKKQLEVLNSELKRISDNKISVLRGFKFSAKENYTDIEISHSPFNLDVFLSFMDITLGDNPKSEFYAISPSGKIDKNIRQNLEFENLSDRVHFFNNLIPVKFKNQ